MAEAMSEFLLESSVDPQVQLDLIPRMDLNPLPTGWPDPEAILHATEDRQEL